MPYFNYVVTVLCETQKEADHVMAERINHDEDYGFIYGIEHEVDKRDALPSMDVSRAMAVTIECERSGLAKIYLETGPRPEHLRGSDDPKPSKEDMERETR